MEPAFLFEGDMKIETLKKFLLKFKPTISDEEVSEIHTIIMGKLRDNDYARALEESKREILPKIRSESENDAALNEKYQHEIIWLVNKIKSDIKKSEFPGSFNEERLKGATVEEVRGIRHMYEKKYNIKIIMSGEYDQHFIEKRQVRLLQEISMLESVGNEKFLYIIKTSLEEEEIIRHFFPSITQICDDFRVFFDSTNRLRELTDTENSQFLSAIEKHKTFLTGSVDRQIASRLQQVEEIRNPEKSVHIPISQSEVIQEVSAIAKKLLPNEKVGYIWSVAGKSGKSHFEFLIIENHQLTKVAIWSVNDFMSLLSRDFPAIPMFQPDLQPFSLARDVSIMPQADDRSCGTLGSAYLKVLLRNNANSLLNDSLRFSYYDREGELRHFLFPAAHTLRYSQSGRFNESLLSLLSAGDTCTCRGNSFTTIQGMLTQSIQRAEEIGDARTAIENQQMLAILPTFRERWIADYQQMLTKRDPMLSSGTDHNVYLAWTTERLRNRVSITASTAAGMFSCPANVAGQISEAVPSEFADLKRKLIDRLKQIRGPESSERTQDHASLNELIQKINGSKSPAELNTSLVFGFTILKTKYHLCLEEYQDRCHGLEAEGRGNSPAC